MPACTGAVAVTSSCFAVHARSALGPALGRSSTMTPSCPLSRAERVPGWSGGSSEYGLFETSTTAASRWERPRSSTTSSPAAGALGPRTCAAVLRERARLGVAVPRPPNCVAVDPERHVVEEEAAVHLAYVDPALDAVGEGVQRADEVPRSTPTSSAKWLRVPAGTQTNGSSCVSAAAAATASDPSPPATPSASAPSATAWSTSDGRSSPGREDDHVDAALACPLGEAGAGCLAAAGPRVDKEHWRCGGSAAAQALGVMRRGEAGATGERWPGCRRRGVGDSMEEA